MACYHPIPARQDKPGAPLKLNPGIGNANLAVPCGTCIGCKTARATMWALRCSHEAKQSANNSFLTLTYDDAQIPPDGQLRPEDLQLFIKRLRRRAERDPRINRDHRRGIRFFACGEYGEKGGRPHYHALLFNCGFSPRARVGKELYEAEVLRELWPYGKHTFGEATPAAASYIAQYTLKKQRKADYINYETGEYFQPPFLRMSLKPAIGTDWVRQYADDLTKGYITQDGRKHNIPRTYKLKLNPMHKEEIEARLAAHLRDNPTDNNTPERRADAEKIHRHRKQLQESRKL